MRISMPKIVTLCALILLASACSMPNEKGPRTVDAKAAGINSKAGKILSSGEFCAVPVTDAAGKTTVNTVMFRGDSVYIRRVRVMTDKSLFPVESEARGTWGLIGDSLFVTENAVTVRHNVEFSSRASDQADCVKFIKNDEQSQFCSCEI